MLTLQLDFRAIIYQTGVFDSAASTRMCFILSYSLCLSYSLLLSICARVCQSELGYDDANFN